ncbi:DUF7002 family protein [Hoeflea sp.]|uniref:DUF7002 family protein n=1 Tax=Hoeflea sp. TaxID=1940281 RepID=UPI003B0175C3
MTEEELQEVIADCPTLYHMAERGSWQSIRDRGLLSTSALLDLYGISGSQRTSIESMRRPDSVPLQADGLPTAVVRDQIPMTDDRLRQCLPTHLSPTDWYEILNTKVFFWLTRDRLHRLTGGRTYRFKSHDVLELDTKSLIDAHRDRIWLCPMNSGNTFPFPHPRDESTFSRIADYPYSTWRTKRRRGERIVELAVDHSVPDILQHVKRAVVMQDTTVERELFST